MSGAVSKHYIPVDEPLVDAIRQPFKIKSSALEVFIYSVMMYTLLDVLTKQTVLSQKPM
jgi:hypothetical protein